MSFASFIASSARDEAVLLQLTGRYVLAGFTATGGGFTNTYQINMPALETSGGTVPSGIYRKVVGVRQNATDLTAQTSVATVDANAGSWWWDEANEVLYVHSTTGSDPDTFSAYQAQVRFFLSTKPVTLNLTDGDASTGVYFHPWLIGTLPELVDRDNDQVFGTKILQGGDITVLNADGWWNRVVALDGNYRWKNAQVNLLLGGSYGNTTLAYSEYEAVGAFVVDDLTASEEEVVLSVYPLVRKLDGQIPRTPYFSSNYPNLGDGVEGTYKWIGYGHCTIRPDLTDDTSYGVYTIADAAFQTLYAVDAVYAVNKATGVRSTLTVTTDYTEDLTLCTVTVVNPTYTWQDYVIETEVTGKPDGAGSYIKTFPDIVYDLLVTHLEVRVADIDVASFAAYDDLSELSLWIKNQRTIASIMATAETGFPALESPVGGILFQTNTGQWRIENWDPGYNPATMTTFRKSDFASFKPDPDLSSVFATVNVYYGYNHATGTWAVSQATSTQQSYLQDVTDVLNVYTFIHDAATADVLAQRLLVTASGKVLNVEIEENGARLATFNVRDKVLVDYDPAPVAAGLFESYPLEVVELRRSFDPTLKMSARLGSLRGIGEFVGRWTDSSSPDYSAATAADKAVSGYWSDSSGYIVPADPSTLNRSVWW